MALRSSRLLGLAIPSSSSSSSSSSSTPRDDLDEMSEEDVWGSWRSSSRSVPMTPLDRSASDSSSVLFAAKKNRSGMDIPENLPEKKQLVRQQSAPMNVPDWSRILRDSEQNRRYEEEDEDEGGAGGVVPPHELVARVDCARSVAFSVCDGGGRRHLNRVRNAVLRQTGFI